MRASLPALVLLLAFCASLATYLDPRVPAPGGRAAQSSGLLETLMGDSRRIFATHFLLKADAYYHSGFYPGIFDNAQSFEESHIAGEITEKDDHSDSKPSKDATAGKDEHDHEHHTDHTGHGDEAGHKEKEAGFLGEPRDWIDRFGRHFLPTGHTHLDEGGASTPEPASVASGETMSGAREMLPWLKLAAELDPNRADIYVVTAYWLRTRMNNPTEAASFLREGLRANPGNPALLFELGRIHDESRNDPQTARNVWEFALRKWQEIEASKTEPDQFLLSQIAAHLAKLEEKEKNFTQALAYWDLVKRVSPHPEEIEKRITETKARRSEAEQKPSP